jgi:hypothetical protein
MSLQQSSFPGPAGHHNSGPEVGLFDYRISDDRDVSFREQELISAVDEILSSAAMCDKNIDDPSLLFILK